MLVTNERHNWKYLKLCRVYHSMMERCYSIKHHAYNRYGGRGIIVCDEWSNGEKFGRSTKGWLAFKEWALSHGFPIIRIWEHDINDNPESVKKMLIERLGIRNEELIIKENKKKRH
jgi:hypothetical protein